MKVYAKFLLALTTLTMALVWLFSSTPPRSTNPAKTTRSHAGGGAGASSGIIPANLARLIHYTDVIVDGTIIEIGTPEWYAPPPTAGPSPTPFVFRPDGIKGGSVYTFYNVRVTDIYKNNGELEINDVITLAVSTDADPFFAPIIGEVNDEYIYFLSKYEYDDLYSMSHGEYGRLLIENAPVRYTNLDNSPVPFATAMSVATFLGELDDEIDRQATATLTPMPPATPDPAETEDPQN